MVLNLCRVARLHLSLKYLNSYRRLDLDLKQYYLQMQFQGSKSETPYSFMIRGKLNCFKSASVEIYGS